MDWYSLDAVMSARLACSNNGHIWKDGPTIQLASSSMSDLDAFSSHSLAFLGGEIELAGDRIGFALKTCHTLLM